ncbi:hypothetical protein GCM10027061_10570 [Nesterenkonia suensis]
MWLARVTGEGPHWSVDVADAELVAVKVPTGGHSQRQRTVQDHPADRGWTAPDRRRLTAELDAMRRLHHDHLVTVYGWVETSCGPGLLLEPFTAGSLGRILASRRTLTLGETVTVLVPIAQALAHLHREGVAHGDVSPGNVVLAPDGRPALADLGDAQLLGAPRPEAMTAGFAAPERREAVRGHSGAAAARAWEESLGPESDVYSLAALTWYVLTEAPPGPERRRTPLGTLCPEAPSSLIRLLEEALSEEPVGRPSAREFAVALHRCAPAQGLDLSPHVDDDVLPELPTAQPGATDRPPRSSRARRLLTGLCAGSLLITGGVGALSGLGDQPHARGTSVSGDLSAGEPTGGHAVTPLSLEAAAELMADEDPLVALDGLVVLRTAALQELQIATTRKYVAVGSPAARSEQELVEDLQQAREAYEGATMTVEPLGPPQSPAEDEALEGLPEEAVSVPVEVTMDALHGDGQERQAVRLELVRQEGFWRLHAIREPSSADT